MKLRSAAATFSAIALMTFISTESKADIEFDQTVTNDVIMGSGISNGANWVTDRNAGLELAIRARARAGAQTATNSAGDSVYNFNQSVDPHSAGQASWNFDFSVNTNFDGSTPGRSIDDFTYLLHIDQDPSSGTFPLSWDPFNVDAADHSFGDNTTGNGAGIEVNFSDEGGSHPNTPTAQDILDYQALIADDSLTLAQQSWTPHWFVPFDDSIDGIYSVWLEAFDGSGDLVAKTYMTVGPAGTAAIVPVPEPSSALLVSLILSIGCVARRKKRAVVEA